MLLLLALALTLGSSLGGGGGARLAEARTFPSEVTKLLALKAELEARGLGYLLDTWKCPPEGEGACDPCGYGALNPVRSCLPRMYIGVFPRARRRAHVMK